MDLEEKKQAYLKRGLTMIVLFAVLGCVVLVLAITYLTRVFNEALPSDPAQESAQH